MTEREKIVAQARGWIGKNEKDGSFREIIDLYNSKTPLPRGYKVKYTDEWCETFRSAVGIAAGVPPERYPRECGCVEGIKLWQKLGAWVENDGYTPSPGDIIYYDWQDTGSGDNTGAADHVGIVEACDGLTITVIEGNKGEAVARRAIAVNGKTIRGFAAPKYAEEAKRVYDAEVLNAVKDIGMTSPDYWQDVLDGKQTASAANVRALLSKYHAAVINR
jgi:hypothetical protein